MQSEIAQQIILNKLKLHEMSLQWIFLKRESIFSPLDGTFERMNLLLYRMRQKLVFEINREKYGLQ